MITGLNREEILRRFTEFLDRALAIEEAPTGIDQELLSAVLAGQQGKGREAIEQGCDSYALWSAMTTLAQEVKLQGRTFKELSEAIAAEPSRMGEEMRAAWQDRERELQRATEHHCRKDALEILIDLRDRMARGLEAVRSGEAKIARRKAGWFGRWFGPKSAGPAADLVSALTKGYVLSIERLDQALGELDAHEIRCQGEMFDPRRMNAVDREVSQAAREGTVLEVYRSGYEWNGEVFRTAQVKVACVPAAPAASRGAAMPSEPSVPAPGLELEREERLETGRNRNA